MFSINQILKKWKICKYVTEWFFLYKNLVNKFFLFYSHLYWYIYRYCNQNNASFNTQILLITVIWQNKASLFTMMFLGSQKNLIWEYDIFSLYLNGESNSWKVLLFIPRISDLKNKLYFSWLATGIFLFFTISTKNAKRKRRRKLK